MSTLLRHAIKGHIGTIELCNPARRNALSTSLLEQFRAAIQEMESNNAVRVVILQSQGSAFSSGHDLKEIQMLQTQGKYSAAKHLFQLCSVTMASISKSPKPFIAKVNGVATAAGCQLVASCDLAYASNSSRFATPGVNIGLFCSTPAVALGRCVGRKKAMEMLLTGEMISAPTAESIGLINAAVPEDELDGKVSDIAELIASKSPMAIRMGKPVFVKQMQRPLEEAYEITSEVMVRCCMEEECKIGIDAFLSKTKPSWQE